MNLRKARFDDHWRRAFVRNYSSKLEVLKFERLLCLNDSELTIPSGICAIVGGNGVGKSALLAAIAELLAGTEVSLGVGHPVRLKNSKLEAAVLDSAVRKKINVEGDQDGKRKFGEEKFEAEFYWLEPSYLVNLTHKKVNEDSNFSELLEPLSPSELDADELEILWYLLGKKIDSCSIYEITEYGDLDPFPYFMAEAAGQKYGSERMGYGELSLLFVIWKLRTIKKNSVLVLEEPEAHVSPRSQRALMDILAKACDEKGLSVILATHSPTIIANIPDKNIVFVSKNANGSSVSIGPTKSQINNLLGAASRKRALVLVEDKAAYQFSLALLREKNADLLSQIDVVQAESASKIDSLLSTFPASKSDWLKIIGLYDGDMQDRIDSSKFNWPHLFLPSRLAAEPLLRDNLNSLVNGQELLAATLQRSPQDISIALDSVDGLDAHDWFTQLPLVLNCEHSELMNALTRIWLKDNDQAASDFINGLVRILN